MTSVSASDVAAAVHGSLTAEFTTLQDDRPATVPLTPFYDHERELVVVTASPAFATKVERAATDPRVSLLLHTETGRLHLSGRATIRDDDLAANAAVVEQLIRDEPPTPKRAAMVAAADFLSTRLGVLLLDWYGLRILIEIDPTVFDRYDDVQATTVPAWPTTDVNTAEAANYDHVVATVVEEGLGPRTWPIGEPTVRDGRLRLDPPASVVPDDGQPACVLLHGHDDTLSMLEQRLIRGRCRLDADGVVFVPASSSHLRTRTPLDFARFVLDGKRRTRAYFATREETYRRFSGIRSLFDR